MKYIWEESDIEVGRYFYLANNSKNVDSLAGSTYKIGFLQIENGPIDEKRYVSISIADGMVWGPFDKSEFAEMLNKNSYIPAKHNKLLKVFDSLREVNEG